MKRLRALHLYLGVIFAPLVLLFSLTGIAQTFRLQDSEKDGSYTAPRWITVPAMLHTDQALHKRAHALPLKIIVSVMSVALVSTMVLGIVLAFKFGHARGVWLSLAIGVIVPAILVWME
jgi:hypothetical protein